jgi:hypothetical protein
LSVHSKRPIPVLITALKALALCAVAAGAAESNSEVAAVRLETPPVIDGRLEDAAWESAARVEGFVQIRPIHGEPSPMLTTALLAYDDAALYVAFRCRDDDIDRIAASITSRDGEFDDDDTVLVMLDTFHDGDSSYYFGTNSLGTQFDGTVANNGRTIDDRWDAAWQNASASTDAGWAAELRIPFEVLRYASGDDAIWGINFQRNYPRRLETSVWAGPGEVEWRVSAFADLTSWSPPRAVAKWWQAIPYVQGIVDEQGNDNEEIGGDLRLRYRGALVADLAVNPDFALVEADVEQVNLTRFELFVPEKRPFFLEGNERFEQRIRQFYSRRIEEIDWGAKAAGTMGSFDFIALGTRAAVLDTDPEEAATSFAADYGVFRLQKAVMGSGNVGLLAANRRLGGDNAGSTGVDTTLFFTEKIGFTGQYLQSHGPGRRGAAWFLRPAYDGTNLHFHVRLTNLDPGIKEDINAVGFLRDDNRREFDTNLTRTWWFEQSPVERIRAGVNYNRFYGHDSVLRSYETDISARIDFTSRWQLELGYEDSFERFEEDFYNEITQLELGYDNREGRAFEIGVAQGKNFGDDLWLYDAELSLKISDAWNIGYEVTYLDLEPDLLGRSTWIHVLRTTYYFTNDLYTKLFAQTNSAIDKENIQLLTVWRILPPFGSLQVAYQRGTSNLGEESTQGNTAFLKLAWVF